MGNYFCRIRGIIDVTFRGEKRMDMQKTGKFLAELRKSKNLTQEQLGEQLGVTNKTVSRWENGDYLPPVEMLQLLATLFGVGIEEILSGERLDASVGQDVPPPAVLHGGAAKRRKIFHLILAVTVAILYLTVSLITKQWQYTWIIWLIYCVYRTAEGIVLRVRGKHRSK